MTGRRPRSASRRVRGEGPKTPAGKAPKELQSFLETPARVPDVAANPTPEVVPIVVANLTPELVPIVAANPTPALVPVLAADPTLEPMAEAEIPGEEVVIMSVKCVSPDCTFEAAQGSEDQRHVILCAHMKMVHDYPPTGVATVAVVKKQFARDEPCKGPCISGELKPTKWRSFLIQWDEHKEAVGLLEGGVTQKQVTNRLKRCFDNKIREELQVKLPTYDTIEEEELLKEIKKVVCRDQNGDIYIKEFMAIKQEDDEDLQGLHTRLQACAANCDFMVYGPCPHPDQCEPRCEQKHGLSYRDNMIRHAILANLKDQEIGRDYMLQPAMDLKATMEYLYIRETTKKDWDGFTSKVKEKKHPPSIAGVTDVPKKDKPKKPKKKKDCKGCGRTHKVEGVCPGKNIECYNCKKLGHFKNMCPTAPAALPGAAAAQQPAAAQQTPATVTQEEEQEESTIQLQDFILMSPVHMVDDEGDEVIHIGDIAMMGGSELKDIKHQMYSHEKREYIQTKASPHPRLDVSFKIHPEGYQQFGMTIPAAHTKHKESAVGDTGAMSVCTGPKTMEGLGITRNQLFPVTAKMFGAGHHKLDVWGGMFCDVFVKDREREKEYHSYQMVYIIGTMTQTYLSCSCLLDFLIIDKDYPTVGLVSKLNSLAHLDLAQCSVTRKGKKVRFPDEDRGTGESTVVEDSYLEDVREEDMLGEEELPGTCISDAQGKCKCVKREKPPPAPTAADCPFEPIKKNVGKIRAWIVKRYGPSSFNCCRNQILPTIEGPPMKIFLKDDAIPSAVHKPCNVPIHWRDEVKLDLDQKVKMKIIKKIPPGTKREWCARAVTVAKKSGKPRLTVDLQGLNKQTVRQTHHTESPFRLVTQIPKGWYKSVLDAFNSYHLVPLEEGSQHLTTFITIWGPYCFMRGTMGDKSAGDGFTHRNSYVCKDVRDSVCCVDDTCLFKQTILESFVHVCEFLTLCGNNGIIFNEEKFVFAQEEIEYIGFDITMDEIRPSKKLLSVIKEYPAPETLKSARRFFGVIQQGNWVVSTQEYMQPFRDLQKSGSQFEWTSELRLGFERAREEMAKAMETGVMMFEKNRPTCLCTDYSKGGVGFLLMQKYCTCQGAYTPVCCVDGWRLALAGGRFTKDAETRYSPVEGESLAVAVSLSKAKYFVLGCPELIVATDHKPLLDLFGDKGYHEFDNTRLLKLKEKCVQFDFTLVYVPGKLHVGPDGISRREKDERIELYSVLWEMGDGLTDDNDYSDVMEVNTIHAYSVLDQYLNHEIVTVDQQVRVMTPEIIMEATMEDPTRRRICEAISVGTHEAVQALDREDHEFHKKVEELSMVDGLLVWGNRLVIPESLRDECLDALHAAHQGVTGLNSRARETVYWPNITADLQKVRANCEGCNTYAPSQANLPPHELISPEHPFQMIACDHFTWSGKSYLIVVDRFSGWLNIYHCEDAADSRHLLKCLRVQFCQFGRSVHISSDRGKVFTSNETESFLKRWGVESRLSSSYNPHSNQRAEAGVKTAKRIIRDNIDKIDGSLDTDLFARAVLAYRNTPIQGLGKSPSMIVFGRQLAEFVPMLMTQQKIKPEWRIDADERERKMAPKYVKGQERWSEHTKQLKPLKDGDKVFIQRLEGVGKAALKWDRVGIVTDDRKSKFDTYLIRVEGSGSMLVRNRKHLRKYWFQEEDERVVKAKHTGGRNIDKYCFDGQHPDKVSWDHDKEATPAESDIRTIPSNPTRDEEPQQPDTPQPGPSRRRSSIQPEPGFTGFSTPPRRLIQRRNMLTREIEGLENPPGRPQRTRTVPARYQDFDMEG